MELNQMQLPHNIDAEQAVLGTILVDPTAMSEVAAFLRPETFYMGTHEKLFATLHNMFITNTPINIVTAVEHSVVDKIFNTTDESRAYLHKLAKSIVNPTGIATYAEVILEKHMMRSLMTACREIFTMAAENSEPPKQIIDTAEKMIFELRNERDVSGLEHIRTIIETKIDEIEHACAHPGEKAAGTLPSSFPDLDRMIFGLNPSDLIIIAGRPAMGKTSFALNVAIGAAKQRTDKDVVIFSLEMSSEQLVSRIISSESRVSSEQMRNGQIDNEGWRSIRDTVAELSQLRVYIDDFSNLSIGGMKAKLRRVKDLGLIVIDYLQLMSTGRRDGNRTQEISEITRSLKLMAKEFNVPVIVVSQLGRGTEGRGDKRPMLADLRESGSIEQDADIVMFMYREAYYNKEFDKPYLAECIVAKNRQGSTGSVELHWDGQFTKFSTPDFRYSDGDGGGDRYG